MPNKTDFLIGVIGIALLTGCAQFNTAFRTYDGQKESVMVDVKQRAIITGKQNGMPVICAEPSPDAMAAYAAEIAGSFKTPQNYGGQLAATSQEGAAYVGLRTQSIQLLRDSLYRLCEGYMNGAITSERFDLLARRYQKNMVALLAIEQLTGTVKAPPITINTQSLASAVQNIEQIIDSQKRLLLQKESIMSEIETLKASIATFDLGLSNNPPPPKEELTAISSKKAAATSRMNDLKISLSSIDAALKLYDETIKNPKGFLASGTTSTQAYYDQSSSTKGTDSIQSVANTVEKIVTNIIDGDDAEQMCIDFLSKRYAAQKITFLISKEVPATSDNEAKRQSDEAGNKLQEFCISRLDAKRSGFFTLK